MKRVVHSPRPRALAAVVLLAFVASCSSGTDESSDDPAGGDLPASTSSTETSGSSTTGEPATEGQPATVEDFEGSAEAFYEVPDPLPAGAPGEVIRTMPLDAPDGEEGLRIMYHSTDAEGDDRAVTGVVYFPSGDAPEGGWPVLAWAHGTSGMAAGCAPSRLPAEPPSFDVQGVRVATDYIGLGPVGEVHPYLSAAAEGNAVIDSVAAARSLPEVGAGDEWVVVGHSQGGHAVLVTNERAADRLPDAELLGAVAVAPGSQLAETYGDDIQVRIITTMVLFGAAAEDPSIDLLDYLTPDAHDAVAGVITEKCLGDTITAVLPFAATPDMWVSDPADGALGAAWLDENDPGDVASDSPLLLVQGGSDLIVFPARTSALFARLCAAGQVVEELDYADADHDTEIPEAYDDISAWVAARFAGEPAADGC